MKEKILIVDDAPENIDFLVGILKEKYKIVAARDGKKALTMTQSTTPPDLILLDILMPDMDGFEVCRQLKQSAASAAIPVLFISGKGDERAIQTGLEAGGADFIVKPFNALLVLQRVATHLELSKLRKKADFA